MKDGFLPKWAQYLLSYVLFVIGSAEVAGILPDTPETKIVYFLNTVTGVWLVRHALLTPTKSEGKDVSEQ